MNTHTKSGYYSKTLKNYISQLFDSEYRKDFKEFWKEAYYYKNTYYGDWCCHEYEIYRDLISGDLTSDQLLKFTCEGLFLTLQSKIDKIGYPILDIARSIVDSPERYTVDYVKRSDENGVNIYTLSDSKTGLKIRGGTIFSSTQVIFDSITPEEEELLEYAYRKRVALYKKEIIVKDRQLLIDTWENSAD